MVMFQNTAEGVKTPREPEVIFWERSVAGADKEYPTHKAQITFYGADNQFLRVTFGLKIEVGENEAGEYDKDILLNSNIKKRDENGETKELRDYVKKVNEATFIEFTECSTFYGNNRKDISERQKLYPEEMQERAASQDWLYRALKRTSFNKDDEIDVLFESAKKLAIEQFPDYLKKQITKQMRIEQQASQITQANADNMQPTDTSKTSESQENTRKEHNEYMKSLYLARVRHKLAKGIDKVLGTNLDEKKPADVAKSVLVKTAIVSAVAGGIVGTYTYMDNQAEKEAKEQAALRAREEAEEEARLQKSLEEGKRIEEEDNKIMLEEMEKAGIKVEKKDKRGKILFLTSLDAKKIETFHKDRKRATEYKFSNPKWSPQEQGKATQPYFKAVSEQCTTVEEKTIVETTYDVSFKQKEEKTQEKATKYVTDWTMTSKAEKQR